MLAARGAAGTFDLWQARGADACLCVGSGSCVPQGCQNKVDIQPGHFKYGWYADPQRFAAALPDSTTTAATSAAQKAMEGISIAPAKSAPLSMKRYSSSSNADMSSQSWYMSRTGSRSGSNPPSGPITISGNEDSLMSFPSSMYTETMEGSIISDSSMMTARTNKTRRGKRGGKKQRENSELRKQQSLPKSPSMVSTLLCGNILDAAHYNMWTLLPQSQHYNCVTKFVMTQSMTANTLAQLATEYHSITLFINLRLELSSHACWLRYTTNYMMTGPPAPSRSCISFAMCW